MKKTLITLAALAMASVAQADIFTDNLTHADWDVTKGEYTSKVVADTTTKAFTLTFAIDWNAAVTGVPTVDNKTLVQMSSKPSNWWSSAVDLAIDGTSITVSVRADDDGTWRTLGSLTLDKENYCVDGLLKLSFTFDGSDTFTLAAMKNDADSTITSSGDITNFTSWSVGQDYGNIYIGTGLPGDVVDCMLAFNTVLDEAGLKAASKAIPEPTTATLSLLALAGLAARRRRK